jgi:phosphoglycerol geranylgeranyltransferase
LAGADAIVTGNLLEENPKAVEMMHDAIKKAGREKLKKQ